MQKQESTTPPLQHSNAVITVGIITVSDRASAGEYADLGGPAVKKFAEQAGWQVLAEGIVPDNVKRIQETIRSFSQQGCGLILTTGGTGIAKRDITPEAIREIMRLEIPGFGEAMRMQSIKITPNAILSRNLAAIVDRSLVIALPGKPSGAVECLGFIAGAIPHAVANAQEKPTSC
jgi:molybdopterin adenylyltransferase